MVAWLRELDDLLRGRKSTAEALCEGTRHIHPLIASSPWQKSFADDCEGFGPRSRREIAGESVDSSRSRNAEIGPKTRTQSERTSATGC